MFPQTLFLKALSSAWPTDIQQIKFRAYAKNTLIWNGLFFFSKNVSQSTGTELEQAFGNSSSNIAFPCLRQRTITECNRNISSLLQKVRASRFKERRLSSNPLILGEKNKYHSTFSTRPHFCLFFGIAPNVSNF